MEKFIKHCFKLLVATFLFMIVLEYIYTSVFKTGSTTSKVSWLTNYRQKDTLDYVLLGSSRVLYFLDPKVIQEDTGQKGINLGYDACGPFEINLLLKKFLKNNKTKKIFLQIDYSYYNEKPDNIGRIAWMPYLKEEQVYDEFKKYGFKYRLLKDIPFFRYQFYESRIGFRYVFSMLSKGDAEFTYNEGYIANTENPSSFKYKPFNREYEEVVNSKINQIIRICEENEIELYFFTAPIYNYPYDFNYFKELYPNYYDFSNTITEKHLYSDQTHLNYTGAEKFTKLFINQYFKDN